MEYPCVGFYMWINKAKNAGEPKLECSFVGFYTFLSFAGDTNKLMPSRVLPAFAAASAVGSLGCRSKDFSLKDFGREYQLSAMDTGKNSRIAETATSRERQRSAMNTVKPSTFAPVASEAVPYCN